MFSWTYNEKSSEFWQKFFGTIVETAFYASGGTFRGKSFVGISSGYFSVFFQKNFRQGCKTAFHVFRRTFQSFQKNFLK